MKYTTCNLQGPRSRGPNAGSRTKDNNIMLKKLLLIAVTATLLGLPSLALADSNDEPRGWSVRVVVSYGYSTNTLRIGGYSNYTDGYDDAELRGYARGYLEAYYLHDGWQREQS